MHKSPQPFTSLTSLFNSCRTRLNFLKILSNGVQQPASNNGFHASLDGPSLWNSSMKSHLNSGTPESAISTYKSMRENSIPCDGYTLPLLVRAAAAAGVGVEMAHCAGIRMGFMADVYFCNAVIDAYMKEGLVGDARKMFDEMPTRDLVSWTLLISGSSSPFALFNDMRIVIEPNEITIIELLKSCRDKIEGMQLHCYVTKSGSLIDQILRNSVLNVYAAFGCLSESERLFEEMDGKDVVSWNIMIGLYSWKDGIKKMSWSLGELRNGDGDGAGPSVETFALVVSGIRRFGDCDQCMELHCLALKSGVLDDVLIVGLLDLYSAFGDLESLAKLYEVVSCLNRGSWNGMISALVENGHLDDAVEMFRCMVASSFQPDADNLRMIAVLCMHACALRLGKSVHGYVVRNLSSVCNEGIQLLHTAIVHMYVKCGDIGVARKCFDRMPVAVKDCVTWSSMIEGCGVHGLGVEAVELFHRMKNEGVKPNSVTFLSLLSACSHAGLLQQGCGVLHSMKWDSKTEPGLDHYTCVVDMLGRYGKVKEAVWMALKVVNVPDSRLWAAVVAAARLHGEHRIAEFAGKRVLELGRGDAGCFATVSNVRASMGRWEEVEQVRMAMKEMDLVKKPGWSWLEVNGRLHGFVSGDRLLHCQWDEICGVIESVARNAIDVGK